MARLANWRGQEFLSSIGKASLDAVNSIMDEVVLDAKRNCPVGFVQREGGWSGPGTITLTTRRGKNKGRQTTFASGRVWTGREPGDLRDTIRRVNSRHDDSVRVYAGTYKINWAMLVENGSRNYRKHPFLRPAFFRMQARLKGQKDVFSDRIGINPKTGLVSYI